MVVALAQSPSAPGEAAGLRTPHLWSHPTKVSVSNKCTVDNEKAAMDRKRARVLSAQSMAYRNMSSTEMISDELLRPYPDRLFERKAIAFERKYPECGLSLVRPRLFFSVAVVN